MSPFKATLDDLTKVAVYGFSRDRPSQVPYHPILVPLIQPR